ncbi:MAG TPA: hypothetical protein DGG95_01230 [Cytophagales bacterium]|jgi:hypothetical protein|nr:hypothetical protein [Cytophagales bacterium]
MLDQLINLVKQHAGDAIINNPAIPNQHNDAAISEVASSIFNGLQNHATSGNLQNIVSLFQNSGGSSLTSNPIISSIISTAASSLATKFGVAPNSAQSIASSLLPTVMNNLISKTNDPTDSSFDLGNILKTTSGNNGLDVSSLIGQVTGGNNDLLGSLGNIAGKFFGN